MLKGYRRCKTYTDYTKLLLLPITVIEWCFDSIISSGISSAAPSWCLKQHLFHVGKHVWKVAGGHVRLEDTPLEITIGT